MENRPVGSAAVAPAGPTLRRRTEEIGAEEALRLLGTVGRHLRREPAAAGHIRWAVQVCRRLLMPSWPSAPSSSNQ